jgi:type I restriction enzyme, S subunit
MSDLPEGWVHELLSTLAQWGSGGTPSRNNLAYYGGNIPWIKTGELGQGILTDIEEKITELGLQKSSAKIFPKGSVAVAMYGATIGKTAILDIDAATNQACAVGIPVEGLTTKEYLFYYLTSQKDAFVKAGQGGAQPNISQTVIKNWSVPLAPLNEQKRIADKLDRLLAKVDACRERCDRIPFILKRFRQSVLTAATSGELTEDWREKQMSNTKEWSYTTAKDLCEWITKGTTPSKDRMYKIDGDVPYIKVYNLCFDGNLDFTVNPTFIDKETHNIALKRSKVFPGDVLMNIVGPPLGKVSIVPALYPEWNINQAIAVFKVKDKTYNKFLAYVLMSEKTLADIIGKAKATAGQFNLTLEICREIVVPVPSLDEQHEIVRRVEILFAFADRLESRYQKARAKCDQLTPALLEKAFQGELVPQDPNDEPASVLLERIKSLRSSPETNQTKPQRRARRAG